MGLEASWADASCGSASRCGRADEAEIDGGHAARRFTVAPGQRLRSSDAVVIEAAFPAGPASATATHAHREAAERKSGLRHCTFAVGGKGALEVFAAEILGVADGARDLGSGRRRLHQ